MLEKLIRWEPTSGIAPVPYKIGDIERSQNELSFFLYQSTNTQPNICVIFKKWVWAYRYTKTLLHHCHETWPFFKVDNSSYLQWLSEQSGGLSNNPRLKHFSFITPSTLLDVIDSREPKIELLPTTKDIS
jgi:hypothetical protein